MTNINTIYKACAIWALSVIGAVLSLPLTVLLLKSWFIIYGEALLFYTVIGALIFRELSHRPDIVADMEKSEYD